MHRSQILVLLTVGVFLAPILPAQTLRGPEIRVTSPPAARPRVAPGPR